MIYEGRVIFEEGRGCDIYVIPILLFTLWYAPSLVSLSR